MWKRDTNVIRTRPCAERAVGILAQLVYFVVFVLRSMWKTWSGRQLWVMSENMVIWATLQCTYTGVNDHDLARCPDVLASIILGNGYVTVTFATFSVMEEMNTIVRRAFAKSMNMCKFAFKALCRGCCAGGWAYLFCWKCDRSVLKTDDHTLVYLINSKT